jgi:hypothetical protein
VCSDVAWPTSASAKTEPLTGIAAGSCSAAVETGADSAVFMRSCRTPSGPTSGCSSRSSAESSPPRAFCCSPPLLPKKGRALANDSRFLRVLGDDGGESGGRSACVPPFSRLLPAGRRKGVAALPDRSISRLSCKRADSSQRCASDAIQLGVVLTAITVTRAPSMTSSLPAAAVFASTVAPPPPTPNEKLLRRRLGEAVELVAGKAMTMRARCER